MRLGGFFRILAACFIATTAIAQNQTLLKVERIAGGFTKPVFVTQAPGDNDRLFIVEQHSGRIRIFKFSTGRTNDAPFLTVTGINTGGEQGLLGLAFDPGYETNGWFYVKYTTSTGGSKNEVAGYRATGGQGGVDTADPSTKRIYISYNQPQSNHNGGWIGFGKDGYLYIANGDGGGSNDQFGTIGNGQNRATLLGKILRVDVAGGKDRYLIPDGNPFKGNSQGYLEPIWAFGLRNPWRCSIDRETGDLWIGDVGQGALEETDFNPAGVGGLNFGWRVWEGTRRNTLYPNQQPVTDVVFPVHEYDRSKGYSVTGGYRYRGTAIPGLVGKYIFADYGTARFWTFPFTDTNAPVTATEVTSQLNPSTPSPKPIANVSSFGEDNAGEIYICDYGSGTSGAGEIYKIVDANPTPAVKIDNVVLSANGQNMTMRLTLQANKAYVLEKRASLTGPNEWTTVSTYPTQPTHRFTTATVPVTGEQSYFRLREVQP